MSDEPANKPPTGGGPDEYAGPPTGPQADPDYRLNPRPLQAPQVDAEDAREFGRPTGVSGAFDQRTQPQLNADGSAVQPPAPALVQAFTAPRGVESPLQRPPGNRDTAPAGEPHFWTSGSEETGAADPWRNPATGAMLGMPAATETTQQRELTSGARLGLREVLFGNWVRTSALVGLFGVVVGLALTSSVIGGLIGWFAADSRNPLTGPDVTLAQVEPGENRPAGSVANVAKKVVPAVVTLEVRVGDSGAGGSGVVIDGAGYILTNNHVVEMAANSTTAKIDAIFADGSRVKANIVGRDPKTDLAVLKVNVANPTVIKLGKSDKLAVGDQVLAVGSPLSSSLSSTVTQGIVSALHRPVRLDGGADSGDVVIDAIQTDAAINHGNSGGALIDSNGNLVGINTAIRSGSEGGGSIGIGFAVAIDYARPIVEGLIREGKVTHADLGVNTKSVIADVAAGAQVQNVKQGGAAAEAGITEGDVITSLGGRKVGTAEELVIVMRAHQPGEKLPIKVSRAGRELSLEVTLKSD
ncbi:PDZ domain-containing protein [Pseudonocardiaceae bacterium YIM PH 21723]|nr:PDZ domain-containing protein [Pseudonocardiaceae bacterium YIM PH 21723]